MMGRDHRLELAPVDVGVNLSGRNIRMAQELLYNSKISATREKMSCE